MFRTGVWEEIFVFEFGKYFSARIAVIRDWITSNCTSLMEKLYCCEEI